MDLGETGVAGGAWLPALGRIGVWDLSVCPENKERDNIQGYYGLASRAWCPGVLLNILPVGQPPQQTVVRT